ncbi:PilW family protein [Caloranaerobacter sp. DY30410]|uniref:PilW family protein n=1 Tax=Caloranaerobacter sp. DY30410 TaxID=3238305 RepID=UPI003D049548
MKLINRRGFTVLELLISLAFASLLILMISTLFLMNVNSYNREDIVLELQYHGQVVLNYFSDRVMEAEGIVEIIDINNIDSLNKDSEIKLKKVIFRTNDNGVIFEVKPNNKFFYGEGIAGSAKTEIADYIESIILKPLPSGKNFLDADGIEITVNLSKRNITESYNTKVFFRNKK